MKGRTILILDNQGQIAELVRESIPDAALSLPSIRIVGGFNEAIKFLENDGSSLLVTSERDVPPPSSIVGIAIRLNRNVVVISEKEEPNAILVLNRIKSALDCKCACRM